MYMWKAGELITAEKLSPRILTGEVLIQFNEPVSDYYRGTATITFPSGFFTETPMVLLTPRTTVPGTFITVGYSAKSVNGFTIYAARYTTVATWIDWMALQVPGM